MDAADQVRLYPVEGGPSRPLPGAVAHERPFGWDDQGFLYVGVPQELPIRIDRIDVRRGQRAPWRELAPEIPGALGISRVLVARDGESLAFNHSTFTTHLFLLSGLR